MSSDRARRMWRSSTYNEHTAHVERDRTRIALRCVWFVQCNASALVQPGPSDDPKAPDSGASVLMRTHRATVVGHITRRRRWASMDSDIVDNER